MAKTLFYVWQLQNDYPGANPNDSKLAIDTLHVKACDGMYPMGVFDKHPREIGSLSAAGTLRDLYDEQLINMTVWTVPHGMYPGYGPNIVTLNGKNLGNRSYAYREGYMHGLYAVAAKALTPTGYEDRAILGVDLEPSYYGGANNPQFWREDLGAGVIQVREYLAGVKAAGVEEVWLAAVHRNNPSALSDCSFSEWIKDPIVTRLMPQVYWTDFQKSWSAAIDEYYKSLKVLGIEWPNEKTSMTFPGNGSVEDVTDAWNYAHENGFLKPNFWRRGTISNALWDAVADLEWPERVDTRLLPNQGVEDVRMALEHIDKARELLDRLL